MVNKSLRSPKSSSLVHVSDVFFLWCLSFSSSFARSSLLTRSLSRCPSIFLELRSKLLGFNILDMNHGPTVLQFLTNLRCLEVLLHQLGYFQLLGPEFLMKCFPIKYSFLKVHLKILDVILQILVIHHLRLKLHLLLIDAPLALLSSNPSDEMHA